MRSFVLLCLAALLAIGAAAVSPTAAAAASAAEIKADFAKELDALLPDMSGADLGKRKEAQDKFSLMCLAAGRPGAEAERAALCAVILPKLGAATAEEGRAWLLRQLQYIARAESVAAVAALLTDKSPRIRECARRTLQEIPGEESAKALRDALAKATTSEWRIAMINVLAQRRDTPSVPAIGKFLTGADEPCALAAAAGLGKIGGPESANALAAARSKVKDKVRSVVLDSYLLCADKYVAAEKKTDAAVIYQEVYGAGNPARMRAAALRGLCMAQGEKAIPTLGQVLMGKDETMRRLALAFVNEIPGANATKAFAALLPKLDVTMQVTLLGLLAARGDTAARPAVLEAAKHQDEAVRVAALNALAGVGEPGDALLLAQTAAASQGAVQNAGRSSLAMLKGKTVDQAMLAALSTAAVPVRIELIHALAARKARAATATFVRLAEGADAAIRGAAIQGLESVGNCQCVPMLVGIIKSPKQDSDRGAAQKALEAICGRDPNKDAVAAVITKGMAGTSGEIKAAMLPPLGKIGGEKAILPVRAALKDADKKVRSAAVRVVSEWPDDAALGDMIAIAKTDPETSHQVLALRGYMNLAKQRDRPAKQKLEMCQAAMAACKRPDEKRLVLGVLRDLRSIEAFRLAVPLMEEPKCMREAVSAAVQIGRSLGGKLPDDVGPAMEKALKLTKDGRTRRDAEGVLKKWQSQQKKK